MTKLNLTDVTEYVQNHIGTFHHKRIQRLEKLKLKDVLKRKNPYLFKAKHLLTAEELIRSITDAFISSNEETLFGDWLEGLAIFVNERVYGGRKSGIPNIDLEFDKDNVRYIVNIKSGPNWGNSSQIKKMIADFNTAKKTLRTSGAHISVVAVNGCCYGRDNSPDKGAYLKYCGQQFWHFISGEENLYIDIVEPLGHQSKMRNEQFEEAYAARINHFVRIFTQEFCHASGRIDWEKLVRFNAGA
ncbi:MAG: cytosolic protein [Bacteroidetes bacterium]|nr:MAG: cytosolic protein [Bacteroidota bacterium]